jgi:predicted DNA-binding mobile mystery protein A
MIYNEPWLATSSAMKKLKRSSQSRSQLDRRFSQIGAVSRFHVPVRGWIRAIREGLGMSSQQLAKRLGVAQPSVIALEQSEAKGTIELATLRRAAVALDCTLVYALVPNKPLETIVRDRARMVLRRSRAPVEHSMQLEDQAVSPPDSEARLDEFIRETNPSRLWDEP